MKRLMTLRRRLLLGAVLVSAPAIGHAGDLTGTVSDATETQNLEGAQITLVELSRTAESDTNGQYRFAEVPAGTYTLRANYLGVPPVTMSVTVPAKGTVTENLVLGTPSSDILVVGQQANLFSALSRKRAADGVEDVLTRDAVGQFPDQNVAESLRRLPGINILNDQGEGRFVSVRGLDPNLNSSSLNGLRVPAPESDVREVALDVVSSDLVESIEVKKTLTPDMDADTIGGSIEINTTSAFDRKKDLFTTKVEGSYNYKRGSFTPKAAMDFATRFTDNFGVAGGMSYYKREFSTDNVETGGWKEADDGTAFTDQPEYRDYDVTRKRFSGTLSFDYKPSSTTTLYARGVFSQFDDQEFRNRLTFAFDKDPSSGDAESAYWSDADGEIKIERDLKDRFERQRIRTATIGGTTDTGPWKLVYQGGWTKSSEKEAGSLDPVRFSHKFDGEGLGVDFDYSNPAIPRYTIKSGGTLFFDPSTYGFDKLERTSLSDSQDEEYSLKGDVSRVFAMNGGEFTIQGGVKQRWRTKMYNLQQDDYDDYTGDLTFADLVGNPTYGLANIAPAFDWYKTRDFFYDNRGDFELNAADTMLDSATSDYKAREDILASYLLGRWDSDTLRVIGGVRMERTFSHLKGNLVQEENPDATPPCADAVCVTPLAFQRSYTDWMPSLNVRFAPAGTAIVLRGAVYRSLMRPNLSDLAPRFLINEDGEAEIGNPDLNPYKAWNFDAEASYYFSQSGALSVAFFHKKIDDFIVDQRIRTPGTFRNFAYQELETHVNGETAKVTGVEASFSQVLDFLPGPFDGLLVQFNYTYTDATGTVFTDGNADDPRHIPLPSSSKNVFNAILGYEKGPISIRVAGTYRGKYLDELGDEADNDRYVARHFQVNLSARYDITKTIQLYADWINVNNEPYFAYQNFAGAKRLLQYETYGPTVKGGVKLKF
ncbi:TonB-dependent receptor [Stakelama pacifica]|uniref:TonB-dependent receptor n=1 Tax=Stakelama pacifica TaxID=517720 RepID=A0A4R6FXM1_9SPHN|nr:TonB-dependent receptor [Stakelama pacifica]TDN86682.1 TonB-dependent receptor [Stakelama pacifica]GGO90364.1 TonB-dependent receptor [Stakelama pacifica]